MINNIKAVAFDIDGTLYSEKKFYFKVAFYYLRHLVFFKKFNKVRKSLRSQENLLCRQDIYRLQTELFARESGISFEKADELIKKIVYEGLVPYYRSVAPFKNVADFFRILKTQGKMIAILSDFPVEQKGDLWGLASLCDVMLSSEKIGALKPSTLVFDELSAALGVKKDEILYVGNSFRYDVLGAKSSGMKSAWITRSMNKKQRDVADIVFSTYRQLIDIML